MIRALTPVAQAVAAKNQPQAEALFYTCTACNHEDRLPVDVHLCPCCDGVRLQLKGHVEVERKTFSTLQARAALDGYTCTRTSLGNIVLGRCGYGVIFDDVASATSWLGGAKGGLHA